MSRLMTSNPNRGKSPTNPVLAAVRWEAHGLPKKARLRVYRIAQDALQEHADGNERARLTDEETVREVLYVPPTLHEVERTININDYILEQAARVLAKLIARYSK